MQILISCAKSMTGIVPRLIAGCTDPMFQRNADHIAMQLAGYSVDELQGILRCSAEIARDNWFRYRRFIDHSTRRPAIFNYDGMVYKKIAPETMSDDDLRYANKHLFIGSFIYGLLRPLDLINMYRLEGDVVLPANGDKTMFDYWKPILTDWFINQVKDDDGILVNLASNEFKEIFDWKRVESELTVITPNFKVEKEGRLKTIVIYAKMCRGAMTRWILDNRITDPEALKTFTYDGFLCVGDYNFILQE